MPIPVVGKAAPDFSLAASSGETVRLSALRGKKVVLYFYPKDNTPGCTDEACDFGAQNAKFEREGAVVLGVSPDSLRKHGNFIKKFKLPFLLLSDEGHKAAEAYGVWGEKINFGHKYMGVIRSTFLIGKDGKVEKAWPKVRVEGHAAEVLAALKD